MKKQEKNPVHVVREPEAGRADARAIAEVARILRRRRLQQRPPTRPSP